MYRTPPRYGVELSNQAREIMYIAIPLHMIFAIYMFSNSNILTVTADLGINLDDIQGSLGVTSLSGNSYLSSKRL